MNECGAHDDTPVIDLTEDDSFLPTKSQNRVKQEMVNGVSGGDDEDDSIPPLRRQSEGDDISNKEDNSMDKDYSGHVVGPTALCQATRVRRQARYLDHTHKGKSYYQGVAFHRVSHLKVSEGDTIKG